MRRSIPVSARLRPIALVAAGLLALAACATGGPPPQLTEQQVCLQHHENNPVERERCYQSPELRRGTPPDTRPQDLPVRSGQISD